MFPNPADRVLKLSKVFHVIFHSPIISTNKEWPVTCDFYLDLENFAISLKPGLFSAYQTISNKNEDTSTPFDFLFSVSTEGMVALREDLATCSI